MFSSLASIASLIGGIPSAFASWMGWTKQKDSQLNTPAMQDNAQGAADAARAEKIKKDIAAAHAGKPQALEADEA